MDVSGIIEALGKFFNSGIGFALIWAGMVGVFLWLASKYNPFQETWKKYEGSIITGIKLARRRFPMARPTPAWRSSTRRCGSF